MQYILLLSTQPEAYENKQTGMQLIYLLVGAQRLPHEGLTSLLYS